MIINGEDKDIRDDASTCNAVWEHYYKGLATVFGEQYRSSEIIRKGFVTGCLDSDLTARLVRMVERADTIPFTSEHYKEDFAFSPSVKQYEDAINTDHRHLKLTPAMLWQLNEVTQTLAPTIRKSLGTPWRVLNVRIWNTPASSADAERKGSLAWHHDGMPKDMVKLLIYLTDLSPDTGSVEWKISENETTSLEGLAGSWLLFQNSVVIHRGVPPIKPGKQRTILELTISPSAINNQTVVHGGNNARHPWRFWQTELL